MTSAEYAADVNEVKAYGRASGSLRTPDPTFTSLLNTPPHPEYLSGHCISSSAAAEVLTRVFGEHAGFTTTSTSLAGVTRSFQSFWDAAREVVDARVFAGIHFRRTCVVSNEIGRKIGKFAMENYLTLLR